jgi:hypothetical protein
MVTTTESPGTTVRLVEISSKPAPAFVTAAPASSIAQEDPQLPVVKVVEGKVAVVTHPVHSVDMALGSQGVPALPAKGVLVAATTTLDEQDAQQISMPTIQEEHDPKSYGAVVAPIAHETIPFIG